MDSVGEEDLSGMEVRHLKEGEGFVLEPDPDGKNVYYIPSFERVEHSDDLGLAVDSKSTTGRVGCMSHGVGRTKQGELITIIQPFAFPLKVTCGRTRLSQVTMRYRDTQFMTMKEVVESKQVGMIRGDNGRGDKVVLPKECLDPRGVLMQFRTDTAYRAKRCEKPIDMDARGTLNWTEYFELIDGNSEIILDEKTLYLLGSIGAINLREVCGFLTREQAVLTGTGAWGHFAGVIQPRFRGEITFEVYSYSKRRIQAGDRAGTVTFDRIKGKLDATDYGGDYQGQRAPRLPKMFKID
jgi:deoxycytidine triphosphate deaminase